MNFFARDSVIYCSLLTYKTGCYGNFCREQQVNEHLQKDIKYSEDLRDEVSICKKNIEELKKKLSQSEKDSLYQSEFISELEQEVMILYEV